MKIFNNIKLELVAIAAPTPSNIGINMIFKIRLRIIDIREIIKYTFVLSVLFRITMLFPAITLTNDPISNIRRIMTPLV